MLCQDAVHPHASRRRYDLGVIIAVIFARHRVFTLVFVVVVVVVVPLIAVVVVVVVLRFELRTGSTRFNGVC